MTTVRNLLRLVGALGGFLLLTPSCRAVEHVSLDPARLRLLTILRMTVFRNRIAHRWPYRPRRAAALRRLRGVLPEWLWYRGLVLPLGIAALARLSKRAVGGVGADFAARTGVTPRAQFFDLLATSLRHPGTLPAEYYVFDMYRPEMAAAAKDIANGYEVETVIAIRQPSPQVTLGSGFPSEQIEVLNNKETFAELCAAEHLAVSRACATFAGGQAKWTAAPVFPPADLFMKPIYGGGGYGAARIFYDASACTYRIERAKIAVTTPYPTAPMPHDELVALMTALSQEAPFLVERRLVAHRDLRELVGSGTLPTLRVITAMDAAGVAVVLHAYLRTAIVDSPVDNVSSGGLAALVDPRTDRLGPGTTSFGGTSEVHPLTGRRIEGFEMPCMTEVRENCLRAHAAVAKSQPHLVPVLGWDVAVTDDGPILVEGNPLSDLSTAQKLSKQPAWSNEAFRTALLSYLAPAVGTRVPLDPGE